MVWLSSWHQMKGTHKCGYPSAIHCAFLSHLLCLGIISPLLMSAILPATLFIARTMALALCDNCRFSLLGITLFGWGLPLALPLPRGLPAHDWFVSGFSAASAVLSLDQGPECDLAARRLLPGGPWSSPGERCFPLEVGGCFLKHTLLSMLSEKN